MQQGALLHWELFVCAYAGSQAAVFPHWTRARGTSTGHSRRGAYGDVDHQGDLWLLGPVRQPAQLIAEGCNAIRMFRSRHHDTCGGGGGGAATFLAIPPRSGESAPGWRVQEGRSEVPASCTSAVAQVIRANTKSERMFSPLPCLCSLLDPGSRRISLSRMPLVP